MLPAAEVCLLDPAGLAGPVWVVAPHPDDEGLGCGGLLAHSADLNTEVWALLLSDGGASHPNSLEWSRSRLADQRLAEWHAGLDELGQDRARRAHLNLPDGALPFPDQPGGPEAVAAIRAAFSTRPPATLLVPWRRDPHPDHRAAHALTTAALAGLPVVRTLEYTVWLAERGGPDDIPRPGEVRTWHLPVGNQSRRKAAAIRAHRSQLGGLIHDDPGGFVLPEDMIERALTAPERYLEGKP